jgi:ankyrin repeat protein
MFPNPQDAIPLPPKPNLERYKKLAADLTKACKIYQSGNSEAIANWAEKWLKSVARSMGTKDPRLPRWLNRKISEVEDYASGKLIQDGSKCRLAEAQFVVARSHGFVSWTKFAKHLEGLAQPTSATVRFEAAVEAIINGKIAILKRLVHEDPRLVKMRSTREHRATLLHYVSANGVEGYRQKTPKNIVKITEVLLKAGAEIDAEADVYGGGATTLGLAATSVHPFKAGVQNHLLQVLLDHGARIDHPESAGNGQNAVLGCLSNGRPEAAIYLAERGARLNIAGAAGIGRLDAVMSFFRNDGGLKTGVTKKEAEAAFVYACMSGRHEVVQFLANQGVNLAAHLGDGQTGLHWAAIAGRLETVKLLLTLNAPLESKNEYGGTVLGQTLWSAAHGGDPDVYSEMIETLIAAGAKVNERHVPVNKRIDALLRKYGSEPEPTWYWFGEARRKKR